MSHITIRELALWQAQGLPFQLLDVRRAGARAQQGAEIAGAHWHDPAAWLDWKDTIPPDRAAVRYGARGHEISQGLTATLRVLGVDARYRVGGLQAWVDDGRPVQSLQPGAAP